MKERYLNRVEGTIIHLMDMFKKVEEKSNQFRKKQIETETGVDVDMMVFFLKMKVISFVPKKWRGDIQKVLFL